MDEVDFLIQLYFHSFHFLKVLTANLLQPSLVVLHGAQAFHVLGLFVLEVLQFSKEVHSNVVG